MATVLQQASQSNCSQSNHHKQSEQTSKQILELCNEHSEFTNKHSKSYFKSKLKSRVIGIYIIIACGISHTMASPSCRAHINSP